MQAKTLPFPERGAGPPPIAQALAGFAAELDYAAIPEAVRERAKHLILDATGIALASTRWDFAHKSLSALAGLGGSGDCTVLGMPARLPVRDAATLNGILVHGLDYDDTHVPGVVHATASAWPCALAMGEHLGLDGRTILTAYVLAVEVSSRLGMVPRGGFHQVGFHPTGLLGAFGCTLAAGRLMGANAEQLTQAQGITLSTAAGSMEFLEDGAWTKRLHPGWAAATGISSAALARQGFIGAGRPYDGRFGLYPSHLGPLAEECDYSLATAALGERWEVERVAVKPFPACHFAHACADAALAIAAEHAPRPEDIAEVKALVPQEVVKTICEPAGRKLQPGSDYDAKFSVQYIVAASLVRGRFGLAELEDAARTDPTILDVTRRVAYEVDPNSAFPDAYSGEVVVTLRDGRELRRREHVNRGAADRPLTNEEVFTKFMENARLAVARDRAEAIAEAVLALDLRADLTTLSRAVAG